MSIVRKNNIGKAVVRLLIGLVVLALIVLLVFKLFIDPEKADQIIASPTEPVNAFNTEVPEVPGEPTMALIDLNAGESTPEPTATPEPTPEPTATPAPTPTPAPTFTPIPANMYAGVSTKAAKYPWKFDKDRIKNGVSSLDILPSANGGSVISMTAWGYANHEEFNGKNCDIWLVVRDEKGNLKCFTVTRSTGLTGIEHTGARNSRNLGMCDFSCVLDVSSFPDGDYQMGTAVRYVIGKNTRSFAYTFGDAYDFTVKNGTITAMGGIENI